MAVDESIGSWARYYTERFDNTNNLRPVIKAQFDELTQTIAYRLDAFGTQLSTLGDTLMATMDDVRRQAADNATKMQTSADMAMKNMDELRSQLNLVAALTTKTADVQKQIDAAVTTAKSAQKAEDDAANAAALDDITRLQAEQTRVQDQLQATLRTTDALVDDIVITPPAPPTTTSPAAAPAPPPATAPAPGDVTTPPATTTTTAPAPPATGEVTTPPAPAMPAPTPTPGTGTPTPPEAATGPAAPIGQPINP